MIELYNENCYERIKLLDDNSVDLILTDPPYEFNPKNKGGGKMYETRKYHTEILTRFGGHNLDIGINDNMLNEFKRVLKKMNLVIFINQYQFPQILNWCFENEYRYTITVWHKTNPIPATNNKYLDDLEYIIMIRENGVKMYGDYVTKSRVYTSSVNRNDKKLYNHPTIKPYDLIEKYVINHSVEGDIVFDPFMGSGTTGVVCKNLNRDFIGVEIDENYFEIAKKRMNEKSSTIKKTTIKNEFRLF